jgi:hypothetical protein
VQLFATV